MSKVDELLWQMWLDEHGEEDFDEHKTKIKQAINAYILGEVMELLKDDELYELKARTIKYPIPEGAKYLQVPVVGIEKFVYEQLRNKANKKFGGK